MTGPGPGTGTRSFRDRHGKTFGRGDACDTMKWRAMAGSPADTTPRRNGRILPADEMGLGKTLHAIGIASSYEAEVILCEYSRHDAYLHQL